MTRCRWIEKTSGRLQYPLAGIHAWHMEPRKRANCVISGAGYGIHWPDLDEGFGIEGLRLGKQSSVSRASLKGTSARRYHSMRPILTPQGTRQILPPQRVGAHPSSAWYLGRSGSQMVRISPPADQKLAALQPCRPSPGWAFTMQDMAQQV